MRHPVDIYTSYHHESFSVSLMIPSHPWTVRYRFMIPKNKYDTTDQGRIQGGGVKTPPRWENFFNLLGFFAKKSLNPPKFFFPYKKFQTPSPSKIFWLRPCNRLPWQQLQHLQSCKIISSLLFSFKCLIMEWIIN